MRTAPDLTGNKYFRLVVMERGHRGARGVLYWRCKCDCGKELEVKAQSLRSGNTRSCGCYAKEVRLTSGKKEGTAFRRVLTSYKWNASRRHLPWELTEEQFQELVTSPCHYTGLLPSNVMKTPSGDTFTYSGIDRLDNTEGYTIGNCVSCCGFVNRAKSNMKYGEFIEMCGLIAANSTVEG